MAERVTDLDSPYLRLLVYGMPGSFKTRTVATAAADPRSAPSLMLDSSGNPVSIRNYEHKPDIIQMSTLKDFNDPYNWIADGQKESHPFCREHQLKPPYKSLIIDQITEVQRMSFNAQTGADKLGPGDFPSRIGRQEFGNTLQQMTFFARVYFSLPLHVILVAQERVERNEVTGEVSYSPLIWGQSNTEVASYAEAVGRMIHRAKLRPDQVQVMDEVEEKTESVMIFKPSPRYVAKDQYGALGAYMVDPSIPKILDLIYGVGPKSTKSKG